MVGIVNAAVKSVTQAAIKQVPKKGTSIVTKVLARALISGGTHVLTQGLLMTHQDADGNIFDASYDGVDDGIWVNVLHGPDGKILGTEYNNI